MNVYYSLASYYNGGVIEILRAKSLIINNVVAKTIYTFGNYNGTFLFSAAQSFTANLTNITIACLESSKQTKSGSVAKGGAIYLSQSSLTSELKNVTISKCL